MTFRFCSLLAVIAPVAACSTGSDEKYRITSIPLPPLMDSQAGASVDDAIQLARTLQHSGASGEALSVLRSAHARYPDDIALLSAYGYQAALMRQDALALRLLQRASDADPEDWRVFSAYAIVAERQGHKMEARQAFSRAREISGANTASLNNFGMFYLLEGQTSDAAAIFRQALISPQIDKDHIFLVKRNLAVALAIQGEFEQAERLAGYSLPRALENAGRDEIAAFMGLDERAATEDLNWKPHVADASLGASKTVR
ncbi:MAG: hypothetical protein KTR19_04750 [Hyphomicrobiales bacterium]|nr:hypothetical protein [Hyphomicrobiales bacterium]